MPKNKKKLPAPDLLDIPVYLWLSNFEPEGYDWESWGLVIRHIRDFAGMDQSIFGRLLQGYTRSQISRYETEETEPPIDFWKKMVRTFGLNISWVFTGKGLPYTTDYMQCDERKRFYKWIELIDEKENFLKELRGL